jgi:hypothetical protein
VVGAKLQLAMFRSFQRAGMEECSHESIDIGVVYPPSTEHDRRTIRVSEPGVYRSPNADIRVYGRKIHNCAYGG